MDKVEQKFLKAVRDFNLIPEGSKIVVGFSGGVDSTVLTYLLKEFQNFLSIKGITLVHVNHQLRATALRDENFCIQWAKKLSLPIVVKRVNVGILAKEKKLSLEEAGRLARYRIFEEIRTQTKSDLIATAHHADDLIETQLLFYTRGSGLEGLEGFSPKEGLIIRPLFYLTKEELYQYARKKNIPFVEDETNLDTKIARNLIRHKVVPQLKQINPSLEDSALRLYRILSEENLFWEKHINELLKKVVQNNAISVSLFKELTVAEQRRLLKKLFPSLGFNLLEQVREFILSNKPFLELDKHLTLQRKANSILIGEEFKTCSSYSYQLPIPGEVFIKETNTLIRASVVEKIDPQELKNKSPSVEYFQIEPLPDFLTIRNRREGDKFIPFGRKKPIKLKEFFIKQKIPLQERNCIPLVVYENQILWVVGIRRSALFGVSDTNKKLLRLEKINTTNDG